MTQPINKMEDQQQQRKRPNRAFAKHTTNQSGYNFSGVTKVASRRFTISVASTIKPATNHKRTNSDTFKSSMIKGKVVKIDKFYELALKNKPTHISEDEFAQRYYSRKTQIKENDPYREKERIMAMHYLTDLYESAILHATPVKQQQDKPPIMVGGSGDCWNSLPRYVEGETELQRIRMFLFYARPCQYMNGSKQHEQAGKLMLGRENEDLKNCKTMALISKELDDYLKESMKYGEDAYLDFKCFELDKTGEGMYHLTTHPTESGKLDIIELNNKMKEILEEHKPKATLDRTKATFGASDEGICWFHAQLFAGKWSHEQAGTLDRYWKGYKYWTSQPICDEFKKPKSVQEVMDSIDVDTMPLIYGWYEVAPNLYHFDETLPPRSTVEFKQFFSSNNSDHEKEAKTMGKTETTSMNIDPSPLEWGHLSYDENILGCNTKSTPEILVGINPSHVFNNEFMQSIELAIGNDTSPRYKQIIEDHDNRVINNTFSRIMLQQVKTVQPPQELSGLKMGGGDRVTYNIAKESRNCPSYQFFIDVISAYCYNNTIRGETDFSEDVLESLMQQEWYNPISTRETTYDITTSLSFSNLKYKFTYLIGPVLGNNDQGMLPLEMGNYAKEGSSIYWAMKGETSLRSAGLASQILSGSSTVDIEGNTMYVVSRKTFASFQLVVLTPLVFNQLQIIDNDWAEFRVPMFNYNQHVISQFGIPTITNKVCQLNKSLINRLLIKNITGKVSKELLTEYALALSWFSYNKRGVELASKKIEAEDIDTHVYVAMVLSTRQAFYNTVFSTVMDPGLGKLAFSFIATLIDVSSDNNLTGNGATEIANKIMEYIKTPDIKSMYGSSVEHWLSIDVWLMNKATIEITTNGNAICHDHVYCSQPTTGKICKCCKSLTATDSGYCDCCQHETEYCYHECDKLNHDKGDLLCKCCGKQSETQICDCCSLVTIQRIPEPKFQLKTKQVEVFDFKIGDKMVKALKTNETVIINPDGSHTHKCVICNTNYEHKHRGNKLPNPNHPQFVGDCPTCKGDINWTKPIAKPSAMKREKRTLLEPELSWASLGKNLPANVAATLMGDVMHPMIADKDLTRPLQSTIPFISADKPFKIDTMNFKVTEIKDVTTNDCGINSIQYYLGPEITTTVVKQITGKARGLNTSDIIKVITNNYENAMIIEPMQTTFARGNAGESFIVIVHSSYGGGKWKNHWLVAKATWATTSNPILWPDTTSTVAEIENLTERTYGCKYQDLTNKQKGYIGYLGMSKHASFPTTTLSEPIVENGIFSNSSTTDFKNGKFSLTLAGKALEYANAFNRSIASGKLADELTQIWDMTNENIFDVEQHISHAIRDTFMSLGNMFLTPAAYSRQVTFYPITFKGEQYVDVSTERLKNGDVIFVFKDKMWKPVSLVIHQNRIKVTSTARSGLAQLRTCIPKASFISTIMKLSNLITNDVKNEDFLALIANAQIISGPGGSGKTTMIGKQLEENIKYRENTIAVATTTGGITSLRTKIPSYIPVMSFEKLVYGQLSPKILVVDEVTLLSPWQLALVTKSVTELILMGDPTQIGVIDYNSSPGSRSTSNLLSLPQLSKQITTLTTTYRQGNPLVSELAKHPGLAYLNCGTEIETNIYLGYQPTIDYADLETFFETCDVVLCFYNDHVTRLRKSIKLSSQTIITTVNKYQGLEAKNVGVLQWPLNQADTHLQFGQCVSAATRPTKSLFWMSIGIFSHQTSIIDRLGMYIGCFGGSWSQGGEIYLNQPIPTVLEFQGEELDLNQELTQIIEATNVPTQIRVFDAKKFSLSTFTQVMKEYTTMIKVRLVQRTDTSILLEFTNLLYTGTVEFKNNEPMPDHPLLPKRYKLAFHAAVANCCIGQTEEDGKISIKLGKKGWYRARILAALVKIYKANGIKFIISGSSQLANTIVDTEGNSCAACTALTFTYKGNIVARIDKDYMSITARQVSGIMAQQVVDSMDADHWDMVNHSYDSKEFSHAILTERVSTWFKDVGYGATGFQNWMRYYREDNCNVAQDMKTNLGIDIVIDEVENMTIYPYFKYTREKILWKKFEVSYMVRKNGITSRKTEHRSDLGIQDLILKYFEFLTSESRTMIGSRMIAKTYMNNIGAMEFEKFPTMIKDIAWHKVNATGAYTNIVERWGKAHIKSLKSQLKPLYVPSNVYNAMIELKIDPKMVFLNGQDTLSDSYLAAAELMALYMISNSTTFMVQNYGQTVYGPYLMEGDNVKTTYHETDDQAKLSFALDKPMYKAMMENQLARLGFDEPKYGQLKTEIENGAVYQGEQSLPSKTIMVSSPFIWSFPGRELELLHSKWKEVWAWGPINFDQHKGVVVASVPGSSRAFIIHEDNINAIAKGYFIKNTTLKWHITRTYGEVALYTLSSNPLYIRTTLGTDQLIVIPTPTMFLDPEAAIRNGTIFEIKNQTYNRHLLSNLQRRMVRPGTTWDDLLVQLRTLLNSSQFSTHALSAQYKANAAEGMACARIAFVNHNLLLKKHSILGIDGDAVLRPKEIIATILGDILEKVIPNIKMTDMLDMLNEWIGKDNIDTIIIWFKKMVTIADCLTIELDKVKTTWLQGNQVKTSNFETPITDNVRIPRWRVIKEENKVGLARRSDCVHCNEKEFLKTIKDYNISTYPMRNDVKGVKYIVTSMCNHSLNVDTMVIGRAGSKGITFGPENTTLQTDLPLKVEIIGEIQPTSLLLPRDLNIVSDEKFKMPIIKGTIVRISDETREVKYAIQAMRNCQIIKIIKRPITTTPSKAVWEETTFDPINGNVIMVETITVDGTQQIEMADYVTITKKPNAAALISLQPKQSWKATATITQKEDESQKYYNERVKRELMVIGSYSELPELDEQAYQVPDNFITAYVIPKTPKQGKIMGNKCPQLISMPYNSGKSAVARWFPKLHDSSQFLDLDYATTEPVLATDIPSDMGPSRNLLIHWLSTKGETTFFNKDHEQYDYLIASLKWWEGIAKSVGKQPMVCENGMDVAMAVSEFTGHSFEFARARFPCGHEKIVPLPLSYKDGTDCQSCDFISKVVENPKDKTETIVEIDEIKLSDQQIYKPNQKLPNKLRTFEMNSKTAVESTDPEIELCFELKNSTWVISSPSPTDITHLKTRIEPKHYGKLSGEQIWNMDLAAIKDLFYHLNDKEITTYEGKTLGEQLHSSWKIAAAIQQIDPKHPIIWDEEGRIIKAITRKYKEKTKRQLLTTSSLYTNLLKNTDENVPAWLDDENNNLTGRNYTIDLNPLIPASNHLAKGRNLLHWDVVHLVDRKFLECGPMTIEEINFIGRLKTKIMSLDPQPNDIWNIYGLDGLEIVRSPSVTPGRHLAICSHGEKLEQLGFETIILESNVKRLFASIRPMICWLLPSFHTVYLRGGRPGLHVLWIEDFQNQNHNNFTKNSVVTPTRTFSPIIDGLVIKTKPKPEMMAWYIAANLKYFDIYGIDEANPDWFDIKDCFFLPEGQLYSNIAFSPKKNTWTKSVTMIDAKLRYSFKHPFKLDWVTEAFSDYAGTMELAMKLDPNLTLDSRNITPKTRSDIKNYIEATTGPRGKISMPETILNSPYTILSNPIHQSGSFSENPTDEITCLFNPHTTTFCVWECLEWCVEVRRQERKDFVWNIDQLKQLFQPEQYESIERIKMMMRTTNLNHIIITGRQFHVYKTNDGPTNVLVIYSQRTGAQHCMVAELTASQKEELQLKSENVIPFKAQSNLQLDMTMMSFHKENLNNIETITPLITYQKEDDNAATQVEQRIRGAWYITAKRKRKSVFIDDDAYLVKDNTSKQHYVISSKLQPGKVYLAMNIKQQWKVKIALNVQGTENTAINWNEELPPMTYIDVSVNLSSVKQYRRTGQQKLAGFLNAESKSWGMRNDWHGELPIAPNAPSLFVAEYDGTNHHDRPFKTIIDDRYKSIHLPQIETDIGKRDWTAEERRGLTYSGPIRLGITNGNPTFVACGTTRRINTALEKLGYFAVSGRHIDPVKLAAEWNNIQWVAVGNRLQPQSTTKLTDAFTQASRRSITMKMLERGEKFDGKTIKQALKNTWSVQTTEDVLKQPISTIDDEGDYEVTISNYDSSGVPKISYYDTNILDPELFIKVSWDRYGFGPEDGMIEVPDTLSINEDGTINQDKTNTISELGKYSYGKHNFWERNKNSELVLTEEHQQTLYSIDALNTILNADEVVYLDGNKSPETANELIEGGPIATRFFTTECTPPIVEPTTMNYWDDETAMVPGTVPLPNRDIRMRVQTEFTGIKQIAKGTMTPYPSHSQPNYIQRMTAGTQAVSDLFGKTLVLRTVAHDPIQDAKRFVDTYFTKNALQYLPEINLDHKHILEWLKERPDGMKIANELVDLFSSGLDIRGMDKVNVHMKLESRMKDMIVKALTADHEAGTGMPETIEEQRVRLIVWQQKGLTAIFAAGFAKVKDHLKRCLKPNVIYTDGLTPAQLSAWCNKIQVKTPTFVEDDLAKQDRQTDATLIATEMELYKLLNMNPAIVEMWSVVHKHWRAKGIGIKFVGDATRQTGQATTALGNAIVNLLVHMRFVRDLGNNLKIMLVLGDDNAFVATTSITASQVSLNSARHFNMVSTPIISSENAGYLRMIIYKSTEGCLELGPDIIRLRRRFEVLNGSGNTTKEKLEMRCMSYCAMLGSLPPVKALIKSKAWPVVPTMWYNWETLKRATAIRYKTTPEYVENDLNLLISMIDKQELIIKNKIMFTEEGH
jgi:guanylate kinase